MGFSLKRTLKKGLKAMDKYTLGVFTLGMTDGTAASKALEVAGLKKGDIPNLENIKNQAELDEAIKLATLEKERRAESKFMSEEGKGLRRTSDLSFGSSDAIEASGTSDQRETGRFDTNRLVL